MNENGKYSKMLVTCPYNASHYITKYQLEKHLEKCRKNYLLSVKNKKRIVTALHCKYNPNEIINAPEIIFHEARCPFRKNPSYLYYGWKQVKVTKNGVDTYPFANITVSDPKEDTSLYDYTFVGQIIGSTTWGIAIEAASMRRSKYAKILKNAAAAATAELKKMDEALRAVKIFDAPEGLASPTSGPGPKKPATAGRGGKTASVDDEDWGKSANVPSFDIMKPTTNRDKPLYRYPIGLNKAQRREFGEINAELFARVQERQKAEEKAKRLERLLKAGDAGGEHDISYVAYF